MGAKERGTGMEVQSTSQEACNALDHRKLSVADVGGFLLRRSAV
jgi:hypothetical protein